MNRSWELITEDRQLFSAVLLKTVKRAIDGKPFAWDKLERTAAISEMHALRGES
jgi:hypothetical protein